MPYQKKFLLIVRWIIVRSKSDEFSDEGSTDYQMKVYSDKIVTWLSEDKLVLIFINFFRGFVAITHELI